jgi:hypothetical protein
MDPSSALQTRRTGSNGQRQVPIQTGRPWVQGGHGHFHIDRVQRYIQTLGFNNILNRPIKVNIQGRTDDNSDYSPVTKALRFGTSRRDDAEDAEIILHEYGHAIQDDQVPGFGATDEGGAMGEGFGDYRSQLLADHSPCRLQPCVGTWDAVSYSGDDPPSLRRLTATRNTRVMSKAKCNDDGEIWSACLWQIRVASADGGRQARPGSPFSADTPVGL